MTQEQSFKKLHIKILNPINEEASRSFLEQAANELNIKASIEVVDTCMEIVVEGEKAKVWEFVKLCTGDNLKEQLSDVLFYFSDTAKKPAVYNLV